MIVLALDTSVTGCSVCVGDETNFWSETMETERGQAESLVPMINDVIRHSRYSYHDLDRIAVTVGPGSFTGVRVGLSTAKGLALSLNKPLLGFSTLDVIARGSALKEDFLALIDTKRGDYYGQIFFENGTSPELPRIWSEEEIASCHMEVMRNAVPDVKILASMALEFEMDQTTYDPSVAPVPMYLRGAEVSQSKRIMPKIVKSV